jgi:tetratricopeptide (TPR) repeat protein
MPSVFLSYRRADAPAHAGRLYDALTARFGSENVFKDLDSIEPGADYAAVIEDALARSDAVIAVIGREWDSQRLEDARDWVRIELGRALARDIRVVPALVQGAVMPPEEALPADLRALSRRQSVQLSEAIWTHQVAALIDSLEHAITRDRQASADADVRRGDALAGAGDREGARRAYERAIESGHPEWSHHAKLQLGDELFFADDLEGARALFQDVIATAPTKFRGGAWIGLGAVAEQQGDLDGARRAFFEATRVDDRGRASQGWARLGDLEADRAQDDEAAIAAYEHAVRLAHPDWWGHAATSIGLMHQARGDADAARAAYQDVIDRGPRDDAAHARALLAELLEKQGDD